MLEVTRNAYTGSLSARRAWIEIPCAGILSLLVCVALRKESVDRNFNAVQIEIVKMVALRKESVDRNPGMNIILFIIVSSLSARRAWIEMPDKTHQRELFQRRSPQGERG